MFFKKWFHKLLLCPLDKHKDAPAETIRGKVMWRCIYCNTRTTFLPWPDPPPTPKTQKKENNMSERKIEKINDNTYLVPIKEPSEEQKQIGSIVFKYPIKKVRKVEMYVVDDSRHYDPECGHYSSENEAYEALAEDIIYTKKWDDKTDIINKMDYDCNNEWTDKELAYMDKRRLRLARYLKWLDNKEN